MNIKKEELLEKVRKHIPDILTCAVMFEINTLMILGAKEEEWREAGYSEEEIKQMREDYRQILMTKITTSKKD